MRGEPAPGLGGETAHHAAYLDFYRRTCLEKCRSLPAEELRRSRVPSGWSPLALLHHLAMMERRWFVWGFLGEPVDDPWADSAGDPDAPWRIPDGWSLDDAAVLLEEYGDRTGAILAAHAPTEVASREGRFAGDEPPTCAGSASTCSRTTPATPATSTSWSSSPGVTPASDRR